MRFTCCIRDRNAVYWAAVVTIDSVNMKKSDIFRFPSAYYVGGQRIEVSFVDHLPNDNLGTASVCCGEIKIANKVNEGRDQSPSSKINTFWHEVVHTILDTMQENELSANEKFVGVFSSMLCEVLNSFEYGQDETSGDREE